MNAETEVAGRFYDGARALTPGKRVAVGAAIAATGVALAFDERGLWFRQLPWLIVLLGAVIVGSAVRAFRDQRRLQRQLDDVVARWPEIEAAVEQARAQGQSPVRALQALGIERFEVRRFVMRRLRTDEEIEAAAQRPSGPAATGPAAAYLPRGGGEPTDVTTPRWLPKP